MKNRFMRLLMFAVSLSVVLLNTTPVFAATSVNISANTTTLTVGQTATIRLDLTDPQAFYQVNVSSSGGISIKGNSLQNGMLVNQSANETITVTATSAGSASVSISGFGEDLDGNKFDVGRTINFTVNNPAPSGGSSSNSGSSNSGGSNSGSSNSGGSNSGNSNTNNQTEQEKAATQKTPEQIAAEKLAERKRNPLISKIEIADLNQADKVYTTLDTKIDVFEYTYEVPKNVAAVKLNLTKIADDVTVTGPETIEFGENEFEKTVTLSAVQDEVAQEIKVKVTRPVTASTTQQVDGVETRIVDRDEADAFLKEFSFKREVYKDANENESFFYTNGSVKLQLTRDTSNNAFWLLLDDNNEVIREVVPVFSDTTHTVSFLWEAPEEVQNEKHQNQSYAPHTFEVSESLQSIDPTLTFNTTVGAWRTENIRIEATGEQLIEGMPTAETESDEVSDSPEQTPETDAEAETDVDASGEETTAVVGFLAYGMDSNGTEGFKYIDQMSNTSMAAFASFDIVDNFHRTWAYVATGVAGVVSVAFLAYFIIERRKVKDLIQKHNAY